MSKLGYEIGLCLGFDHNPWSVANVKFTQLNRSFEKSSRGVMSLKNLLQELICQHNNGMSLKIMAKLSSGNQNGIGELLNF